MPTPRRGTSSGGEDFAVPVGVAEEGGGDAAQVVPVLYDLAVGVGGGNPVERRPPHTRVVSGAFALLAGGF